MPTTPTLRTSLAAAVVAAVALLGAGCTSTDAPATQGDATPLDATGSASPEADEAQQDDATGAASPAADEPTDDQSPAATEGSTDEPTAPAPAAAGDGCTPGTSDTLPDGEWFGFLVDTTSDDIEFDLACWYSGEDAELVAAQRGEPEVTNDYIVTNDNPALRTLPRAGDLEVERLTDDLQTEVVTFDDYLDADGFYASICPGQDCSVWIIVRDGRVVELAEQYRP